MTSKVSEVEDGGNTPPDHLASASPLAERCYVAGRAAFPGLEFDWLVFRQAWSQFGGEETSGAEADDYVRLACLADVPGATELFESQYLAQLRGVISRICHDEDTTDVALQELREKLLLPPRERLSNYQAVGQFRAWLRVVATRTALDVMRRRGARAKKEVTLEAHLEALALDPEDRFIREESARQVRTALRAAVKRLPDRQRHALRMHLVLEWNVTEVGRVFSVHRATAARWIASAKTKLHDLFGEELSKVAPSDSDEAAAYLTELPSRLDVSLSMLFRTTTVLTSERRSI